MTLKPRQPVPALEFDTLGGGHWSLAAQKPQNFTMIVFYRGLHCPVCRKYTSELNGMIGEFDKRGVSTVITSTDPKDRAEEAKTKWGLPNLTVGYGVSIDKAREWGLYISTMPFARPHFGEIAQAIDFALSKNYPARGEA